MGYVKSQTALNVALEARKRSQGDLPHSYMYMCMGKTDNSTIANGQKQGSQGHLPGLFEHPRSQQANVEPGRSTRRNNPTNIVRYSIKAILFR
ncbi:hypothetical protein PG990_007759 [Apiospora arundinis]